MDTFLVALLVYVITIIGSLDGFLAVVAMISGILFAVCMLIFVIINFSDPNEFGDGEIKQSQEQVMARLRQTRNWIAGFFLVGLTHLFIPNENQTITIVAAAIGYEGITTIVEDERVRRIGGKSLEYLENWVDTQIRELEEDREEEGEGNTDEGS